MPHELIAAAFLHDIGHLVGLKQQSTNVLQTTPDAPSLGISNHERIGSSFLKHLGFSDSVCIPVAHHVLSKRYLLTTNPDYVSNVSDASMQTFVLQGGNLTQHEILAFEASAYFEESVKLRHYDDAAKSTTMDVSGNYDQIMDIVAKVLELHTTLSN